MEIEDTRKEEARSGGISGDREVLSSGLDRSYWKRAP